MLDHAGVGFDRREFQGRIEFERDGSADQSLEHFVHGGDGFAKVDRFELHDVLAAEHQQLAGQTGGALGGKINGLDGILHLLRHARPGQQDARVALNDGEHVVEVVRDAGSELTDRLHLL